MAGRYVTLVAATDYLEGEGVTGFVSARAISSEAIADLRIDTEFHAWDRLSWINGQAPPEIRSIALKLASSEYIRRGFNKASPDASRTFAGEVMAAGLPVSAPVYAADLLMEANNAIHSILGRGYLHGADGSQIFPANQGEGSIFARVTR